MDMADFKYNGVNITAFRLVDRHHPQVLKLVRRWSKGKTSSSRHLTPLENERGFRVNMFLRLLAFQASQLRYL